jgi:hypothetical protein
MAIRTSTEKIAQKKTNVNLLTRQMGEMSRAVIAIIKTEKDLYIFCERRRKDIKDKTINTENLIPAMVNKIVPYQNLQKLRLFYGIDYQDPYFFIKKKLPPGTVIHQGAGY